MFKQVFNHNKILYIIMERINFKSSLNNYRPIYFYFLDGLIDKDIWYDTEKTYNFFINNNLINDKINLLEIEIKDIFNLNLNFKFNNKEIIECLYNHDTGNFNINYSEIWKKFDYCISQQISNNHATSLLIYKNEEDIYISSFNSGAGINNHESHDLKYKPYFNTLVGEKNENNFNKILSFLLLQKYFDYINNSDNYIGHIRKLKKFINKYIYITAYEQIYQNIPDNDYHKIPNIININYYKTLLNLLEQNFTKNNIYFNLDQQYIIENLSGINKYLLNKIILHIYDNQTYINQQESGSCTFYSIYWPIIYYNVINSNIDEYIRCLKKFYNDLKYIVNNIFTSENFQYEYSINNSQFIQMKILYTKLCDINVIDNKSINDIDFIYNNNFTLNILSLKNHDLKNNYNEIFISKNIIDVINTYLVYDKEKLWQKLNTLFMIVILSHYKRFFSFNDKISIDNEKIKKDISKIINDSNVNKQKALNIVDILFNSISNYIYQYNNNNYNVNNYIYWIKYILNITKIRMDIDIMIVFAYRFNLLIIILSKVNSSIKQIHNLFSEYEEIYTNIGNLLYKIIYNIIDRDNKKYISNYFSSLIQYNFITINHDFKYINHFIPYFDDTHIQTLEKYERSVEDYERLINFLYNHPEYIHDKEIDSYQFVKLNIPFIKHEKQILNKIISFYGSKYLKCNNDKELFYIIINLQLLITNKICQFDSSFIHNIFVYEYCSIDYDIFKNILKDNINEDEEYFIKWLCELDIECDSISYIIKNHFDNYKNEKDKISINDKIYQKYDLIDCTFNDIFNVIPRTFYLINETELLILNYKYYIKIVTEFIDTSKLPNSLEIRIKEIYFNGKKVIKYSDINYPFKYLIPTNCFHLIYDNNITYFVNNVLTRKDSDIINLLGYNKMENGIYTITINHNTQFLIDKMDYFPELCKNYHINKLNLLYINFNEIDKINTGFYLNQKYYEILNVDKNKLLLEKLVDIKYENTLLLKESGNPDFTFVRDKKYIDFIEKFQNKISKCKSNNIESTFYKIEKYKCVFEEKINDFNKMIINRGLFSNYEKLYEYLNNIKLYNLCKSFKIDKIIDQIRIYKELFNLKKNKFVYNFEALFELITGYEITEEQMTRYTTIINDYYIYKNSSNPKKYEISIKTLNDETSLFNYNIYTQTGGNKYSYPLHHFMMGKGKSSVITPLLTLYFIIKENQKVFIIVPKHLIQQTIKTMKKYIEIFEIKYLEINMKNILSVIISKIKKNNLFICSDNEIKELFLLGIFNNSEITENTIMLIDEFDYILDPIKSNFNIVQPSEKPENFISIYNLLKPYEDLLSIKIIDDNHEYNIELINNDLENIIQQINNKKLIENIKWGIHPTKLYAIPYRSKDNPLLESKFSSNILTVFLTLYYFKVIKKYKYTNILINYIYKNNILEKYIHISKPNIIDNKYLEDLIKNKKEFFNNIFDNIFSQLIISEDQQNTSFIDIININNIFKIGYSGTVNINLPQLDTKYNFNNIFKDDDEALNVKFAIKNSSLNEIIDPDFYDINKFFCEINISNYNALIDIIGLFKDYNNDDIASIISKIKSCNIIYMDKNDEKYIMYYNGKNEIYDESIDYDNPFIYYSQSHTIGIDINQDKHSEMKGLCIINNQCIYSQVAQSIFRLRKLNITQTIDFLFISDKECSNPNIYDMIVDNEKKSNENKKDYLIFQTIKSIIRKKNGNYHEKIKFYYKKNDDAKILDGIINIEDINTDLLKELFCYIDDIDKIKKLVYNMNIEEYQQEKINVLEIVSTKKDDHKKIPDLFYEYKKYSFESLLSDYDIFINNSIILEDNIRYLPNIFSQINEYKYSQNTTELLFVYIHDQLLIIPKYIIHYFYEYPIVNSKFVIINNSFEIYQPIQKIIYNSSLYHCIKKDKNKMISLISAMINDHLEFEIETKDYSFLEINHHMKETMILPINHQENKYIDNYIKFISEINNKFIMIVNNQLRKLARDKIKNLSNQILILNYDSLFKIIYDGRKILGYKSETEIINNYSYINEIYKITELCEAKEIIKRMKYIGINIDYSEIFNLEYKKTPEYRQEIKDIIKEEVESARDKITRMITDANILVTENIKTVQLKILKNSDQAKIDPINKKLKEIEDENKIIMENYFINGNEKIDEYMNKVEIDNFDVKIITKIISDIRSEIDKTIFYLNVKINEINKIIDNILTPRKISLRPGGVRTSKYLKYKIKYLKLKESLLL